MRGCRPWAYKLRRHGVLSSRRSVPAHHERQALIVETQAIFLAGSYLVKAAIGEDIDNETLGGAETGSISGVADYVCDDDEDALKKIRRIVSRLKEPTETAGIARDVQSIPTARISAASFHPNGLNPTRRGS